MGWEAGRFLLSKAPPRFSQTPFFLPRLCFGRCAVASTDLTLHPSQRPAPQPRRAPKGSATLAQRQPCATTVPMQEDALEFNSTWLPAGPLTAHLQQNAKGRKSIIKASLLPASNVTGSPDKTWLLQQQHLMLSFSPKNNVMGFPVSLQAQLL